MNPFAMTMMDIWMWLKWQAIWAGQRLTRYLMPHGGLKAGFCFGEIQVRKVGWHQWGYRPLTSRVDYFDGKRNHIVHFERFGWVSRERFLWSSARSDFKLPENCVWVCDEREILE